jgi:hypothetical protein
MNLYLEENVPNVVEKIENAKSEFMKIIIKELQGKV